MTAANTNTRPTADLTGLADRARDLFAAGDAGGAETLLRQIVAQRPDEGIGWYNLGTVLLARDRLEDAAGCCRRAIELAPGFAPAYSNFGLCLNGLNMIPQARQAFELARQLTPDDPVPVLNSGIAALTLGDYPAGWRDFAARWQLPAYAAFRRSFSQPAWDGFDLAGQKLLIYAEQGFGDTIQMARFIPALQACGAEIVLECPLALVELMRVNFPTVNVVGQGEPLPAFDCHVALMDIPGVAGVTLDDLDGAAYLQADAALAETYRVRRGADRIQVGLCWAGRSSHGNDRNRSLALESLGPLWDGLDVDWVSLQRVVPEQDEAALGQSPLQDWGRQFVDFATTAAAIAALDLVITVDTSVAHLAGAMGKPAWVLLPFNADWRWLLNRSDSPWYRSARLFRQSKRGDWNAVLTEIQTALQHLPRS